MGQLVTRDFAWIFAHLKDEARLSRIRFCNQSHPLLCSRIRFWNSQSGSNLVSPLFLFCQGRAICVS